MEHKIGTEVTQKNKTKQKKPFYKPFFLLDRYTVRAKQAVFLQFHQYQWACRKFSTNSNEIFPTEMVLPALGKVLMTSNCSINNFTLCDIIILHCYMWSIVKILNKDTIKEGKKSKTIILISWFIVINECQSINWNVLPIHFNRWSSSSRPSTVQLTSKQWN